MSVKISQLEKELKEKFKPRLLVKELKEDFLKRGFLIKCKEENLNELSIFCEELLEQNKLDVKFFEEYNLNFLALIGETFIQEHGGEWVFTSFPNIIGIKCTNGNIATDFTAWWADIVHEEISSTGFVTLLSPYSSIKIDCQK